MGEIYWGGGDSLIKDKRTQGLLFYGARSTFYPNKPCYGIVITARCDLVQNKIPTVHFVTVIPIADWIKTDCAIMIGKDIRNNVFNKLSQYMTKYNLDRNTGIELGPEKFERVLLSYETNPKNQTSISAEMKKWKMAEDIVTANLSEAEKTNIIPSIPEFESIKKKKIENIVNHQLRAYYFFAGEGLEGKLEFVANFRDIQTMKLEHFDLLLEHKIDCRYRQILYNKELKETFFLSKKEDFAMYTDVVMSPNIEHLMQSFAFLYSRIGIKDVPDETINKINGFSLV
jgi:hypothetical protein